jgi:hypothetical protein
VQSGLSYDKLVNGTLDLLTDRLSRLSRPNFTRGPNIQQTSTLLVGTFPSNSYAATTNTSANAAKALWHAMQVFLGDMPDANSSDRRVSIWTQSYGGRYGPRAAAFVLRQNENIRNRKLEDTTYRLIQLDALGIVSGCIDRLAEGVLGATFGRNNTYGVQYISEADMRLASRSWPLCEMALNQCDEAVRQMDPENTGGVAQVNSICQAPFQACGKGEGGFQGRSLYDIAAPAAGEVFIYSTRRSCLLTIFC